MIIIKRKFVTHNVGAQLNPRRRQPLSGRLGGVKYESYLNKYDLRRRLKVGRVWESRMSRGRLFQILGAR